MIQLRPREYFTIVRGLPDHTDSGTYYVRAVIRNAKTDAIIETVNLTDQGTRRFSYPWQVPADPSGEGFYIVITTTVYSDSGYTSKAEGYGEEFATYLIQDRINPNNLGFSGPDIDYKKIKKMIDDAVANVKIPEPKEMKEYSDAQVLDSLAACMSALDALPGRVKALLPVIEKTDLKPLQELGQKTLDAVGSIEIPEAKAPDFAPITEALEDMRERLDASDILEAKDALKKIDAWISKFGAGDMDELKKLVSGLSEQMESMPYIIKHSPDKKAEKGFVL